MSATATPAMPSSSPRRILLATDATPVSADATAAAIDLAAQAGATLIVVSVVDPARLRSPGGVFRARVDDVRADREVALRATIDVARGRGVRGQYLIWEGEPGQALVEAAASEGADLIIIGSHGRGPLSRLLLGSVSSFVVEHADRQVIVVRPGDRLGDVWPPDMAGRDRSGTGLGAVDRQAGRSALGAMTGRGQSAPPSRATRPSR